MALSQKKHIIPTKECKHFLKALKMHIQTTDAAITEEIAELLRFPL